MIVDPNIRHSLHLVHEFLTSFGFRCQRWGPVMSEQVVASRLRDVLIRIISSLALLRVMKRRCRRRAAPFSIVLMKH